MKNKIKKFKPNGKYDFKVMFLWVGVFAAIGVATLLLTQAAPDDDVNGTDTTCVFSTAGTVPAYCDAFSRPAGNGSKTGDLNPVLWGVSRIGSMSPDGGAYNKISFMSMTGCGSTAFMRASGNDVRICNGRMFESMNDGGAVTTLHTYPKQPFNFAGRTGKVVFDVTNNTEGTHAAWPEFAITDKPVPGVFRQIGTIPPVSTNQIGFSMAGCGGNNDWGIDQFFMSKNSIYSHPAFTQVGCVQKASGPNGAMNHVEVRVNQSRIEVWATDPGATTLELLAFADNLGMSMTQGLVWMNDAHYNARKGGDGSQFNHTFAWDNLGFDGPKTYRDLGFDILDANVPGGPSQEGDQTTIEGYRIDQGGTFTIAGVRRDQTPTGALIVLNSYQFDTVLPSIRINGGPWIDTPWPFEPEGFRWVAASIPVPVAQIRDGNNTIEFRSSTFSTLIANISLILVAGAPVPGGGTTPPPPSDTTAPTVSLTAPTANATVSGANVSLAATASDGTGVTKVEFLVDGVLFSTDTTSPYVATLNSTTQTNGSHNITAKAYDSANNVGTTAAVNVTVSNTVADTTNPTISISSPLSNATISGTIAAVQATASDAGGINRVEFYMDSVLLGSDNSSPYSFALDTTQYTNGSHSLTAKAVDSSNNQTTSAAVNVTVNNADTAPPSVIITAPFNNTTISGTYNVSVTAADAVGVSRVDFSVDGGSVASSDTSSPFSYQLNTTTLSNGSHTIRAAAYDAANNTNSATAMVTVNNTTTPPPTVTKRCDFNTDTKVDTNDLFILLGSFNRTVTANTRGDCTGDGKVDINDLFSLLGLYGK